MVGALWGKVIDPNHVFVIAEAGVNHNGDIQLAKKLVDVAVESGADAVKFQTFHAESLAVPQAQKADYQKETTAAEESQVDMLKRLELSQDAHKELLAYCQRKGILFLSTAFDLKSVDLLNDLGVEIFKIPSGEITNLPLLKHVAFKNKPMIVSTGMATLEEVEEMVAVLKACGNERFVLLHCVSCYPANVEDVNLKAISTLGKTFNVPVGYSDHTAGIEIALAATGMGVAVLEKHFTLDQSMEGPDHKASLNPGELKRMIQGIRNVEKAFGDGIKKPAESEIVNLHVVRKSLFAKEAIQKGDVFSEKNITAKRPAEGINPMKWDQVVGQKAKRDFKKEEMIEI
ncbi:MAG: N-acetylneuraminate synthase [Candidatus Omnitrophica bacterium]|nr:N-acetylneuraminate synthase [Candidatus Omnitrophota bacterium]